MRRKRKSLSKTIRKSVYERYGGRCGYCGCEMEMKQMQVDHMVAFRSGGSNELENLMPSCRMCNYYKGSGGIESFRKEMKTLHERLMKPFIHRLGAKYNLITVQQFDGLFYFEKHPPE